MMNAAVQLGEAQSEEFDRAFKLLQSIVDLSDATICSRSAAILFLPPASSFGCWFINDSSQTRRWRTPLSISSRRNLATCQTTSG